MQSLQIAFFFNQLEKNQREDGETILIRKEKRPEGERECIERKGYKFEVFFTVVHSLSHQNSQSTLL